MNYTRLLDDIKYEVMLFFRVNGKADLPYHNLEHTENVVSRAAEIATHYQLNDLDFFIVSAAAWYHDTGYYINGAEEHELRGSEKAAAFLKERGVDEAVIAAVGNCIMATKIPQRPQNLLEQIVCDADLFHLGTDAFGPLNKQMRKEVSLRVGKKIPKEDWRRGTIRLLESHHYHTDYSQQLLTEKKRDNLQSLKDKEKGKPTTKLAPHPPLTDHKAVPDPSAPVVKKQKPDRPERGIETMFRISSNNHQRLSDMADNKAHIMITTTSIIISVLLSLLLRKLEDNPHLIFPTILLLMVCMVTMVFSILATRPSIPDGTFTQQNIDEKKVNLLFFGNFYRMDYDDYYQGMLAMMNNREFLYGSLTKDVYSQGVVLGRKYRLLRIGYNVFMFGIIVSVIAFVAAVVFFQ